MIKVKEKCLFSISNLTRSSIAADAHCKLDVSRHDCDALGVDGTKIGVLEQTDAVSLGRFLQGRDGSGLIAEVGLEVHRDLFD